MVKTLKVASVGPQVGWGRVSDNSQGGKSNDSQVDEDRDTVPICQLCRRRAQKRNNGLCQHFSLGDSSLSSSHPVAKQISFYLYVPGAF